MPSMTTEPPNLSSIQSYSLDLFSADGAFSLRRVPSSADGGFSHRRPYSCYNCNYYFHIIHDAGVSYPLSFLCPGCNHRHLIPHNNISPPPRPPPPNLFRLTEITSSITPEPHTIHSIPSYCLDLFSADGSFSLRRLQSYAGGAASHRSYICDNCDYAFSILNTTISYPVCFRCPQCHHRHQISRSTASLPPPPQPPPPLSIRLTWNHDSSDPSPLKSYIDSLPIKKFPPNSSPSSQSCTICLDDFAENPEASGTIKELPCKHYFHRDCIAQWLKKKNNCPICRRELPSNHPRPRQVGTDRRTTEIRARNDDSVVVVGFSPAREQAAWEVGIDRRTSELRVTVGFSPAREQAAWGTTVTSFDRPDSRPYGGRVLEVDAMQDDDGDTLMMDA